LFLGTKDKIELKVSGMTCGHCEAKLEKAISQLSGIKKVTASRTNGMVTVEPDKSETLDLQKIKEAIQALGYQVTE
jgi:copper chaperone